MVPADAFVAPARQQLDRHSDHGDRISPPVHRVAAVRQGCGVGFEASKAVGGQIGHVLVVVGEVHELGCHVLVDRPIGRVEEGGPDAAPDVLDVRVFGEPHHHRLGGEDLHLDPFSRIEDDGPIPQVVGEHSGDQQRYGEERAHRNTIGTGRTPVKRAGNGIAPEWV